MAYIDPALVTSPKGRVSDLEVLLDRGEGQFSIARMSWDGGRAIGIRWNGGGEGKRFEGLGNPQSRGVATWFILPKAVADVVEGNLERIRNDPSGD